MVQARDVSPKVVPDSDYCAQVQRCRERFGVVGPQGTPSASVELARRMIKPNEAFGEIELWHMNTNIGSNQGLDRDRCSLLIELDIELESYPRV